MEILIIFSESNGFLNTSLQEYFTYSWVNNKDNMGQIFIEEK